MYTSVLKRFTEWSERIPQLLQEDADFREMCADYGELATWLETNAQEDESKNTAADGSSDSDFP